jgi:hypothetical protein
MLDQFKLYGSIVALVVLVSLGATVKILWDRNSDLSEQLTVKTEELAAAERGTRAVEQVAQMAAERAVALQPIRMEVLNAPAGGCVGPGVRAALDGLRGRQAGTGHP